MKNIVIGKYATVLNGNNNVVIGNGALLSDDTNTLLIDLGEVKIKAIMTDTQAEQLTNLLYSILSSPCANIEVTNNPILH